MLPFPPRTPPQPCSTPIIAPATGKTVAHAPRTAATAVPFRAASHDSLPNLLKRSAKDQPTDVELRLQEIKDLAARQAQAIAELEALVQRKDR